MTDDEKAELADVYEKAAEYLEEHGWIQGTAGVHGGRRCFIGATYSVVAKNKRFTSSVKHLWDAANNFAADVLEVDLIHDWNDDPSRTKDEVINTLHALANKLR